MIREEYVTFETAKLLKEAGLPRQYVVIGHNGIHPEYAEVSITQAQAMRWLREEKKIAIEPTTDEGISDWQLDIFDWSEEIHVAFILPHQFSFGTYEAAAEAGIQAACKYLIEKQKGIERI